MKYVTSMALLAFTAILVAFDGVAGAAEGKSSNRWYA
jgi:hypothetical protein